MPLPDSIAQLIDNFAANRSEYHKGDYNETQTRVDYVNPLFAALGWDIDNAAGLSEVLREVIHEDKIKIGGHSKAPDYSFRAGGTRKFFAETKKPSVNLFLLEAPAFQLRRYAWTVKMPVSILTNFEEFAVYDTRVRPNQKDPAKTARLDYFKYTDYAEQWDALEARFSRDAVLSGAFDRYAAEARDKRIAVPVDVAFLSEISGWREKLARNIALNNPGLGSRELNYAVQMIIDRIIFLRISEDRGAEPDFLLRPLLNKGGAVYPRLLDIFRRADARYNSGLFHFGAEAGRDGPDMVTPHLTLDDRPLKEIIASVYYPESPFEFSVFPADILGQVYEQFLGKVIRVSGKSAEVEDKPEVKKAGGVYYTPTYIVDYIVRSTVGRLVDGKTPAQVSTLAILDPACGSGSFLIGAYQFLLDWHLKYYTENDRAKWAKAPQSRLYLSKKDPALGEVWRLTTAEKKRILLNNIYGVDIDTQAVEVSKLSLLLKVLEGESAELIDNTLKFFHERALPDLEGNIKCGNSLIGPDFYEGKDLALFDLDAQLKINTFDWRTGFPSVMKAGGFDAVIGNPPWGATFTNEEKLYLRQHYETVHVRTPESFNYFLWRAWNCTHQKGIVGVIIPSSFLNQHEFWKTRKVISEEAHLARICNLGDGVFAKVTAPSCIVVFSGGETAPKPVYLDLRTTERTDVSSELSEELGALSLDSSAASFPDWHLQPSNSSKIHEHCYMHPALKDIAEDVATGISSGLDAAYVYTPALMSSLMLEADLLKKLIIGGEINRYFLMPVSGKQIIYATPVTEIQKYPHCEAALLPFKQKLLKRREAATGKIPWFALNWPRRTKLFESPKILIRQTASKILASVDYDKWYCLKSGIIVQLKSNSELHYNYLLGLLNSRLMAYLYDDLVGEKSRVFPEVKPVQLFKLPIRTIDFAKPAEKAHHDKMVGLVERMLKLHQDKAAARLASEKNMLQVQIEAIDTQIDALVYELYGLTDDEIKVVEGAG